MAVTKDLSARRARVRRLVAKRPAGLRITVERTDVADPDGWERLMRIFRRIVDNAPAAKDPRRP